MINVLMVLTGGLMNDGISNCVFSYLKFFDYSKFKVYIVAPFKGTNKFDAFIDEKSINFNLLNERKRNPVHYFKKFSELLKNNKIDIVHVHGSSSMMVLELMAAKKSNIKIRIAHSHNTTTNHFLLHCLFYPFFKKSYNVSFACNIAAGKRLFHNKDFCVIKNAIELERFVFSIEDRIKFRQKYGFETDDCVLLNIGRFNKQKNQIYLIKLLRRLIANNYRMNFKVVFIGTGEKKAFIQKKVFDYNLRKFAVFIDELNNVHEALSGCDIFVLPSKYEGQPLTLIEAQANGIDCVVSKCVSYESQIAGNLIFLPLEEKNSLLNWTKCIHNIDTGEREKKSSINQQKLAECGYSLSKASKSLCTFYFKLVSSVK